MPDRKQGFTLIELMLTVAIIGILSASAVPKFADLIRKSREGSTKGNLGALRSALLIYYADNEGRYPVEAVQEEEKKGKNKKEKKKGKKKKKKEKEEVVQASSVLADALVPKYLDKLPAVHLSPYHAPSDLVRTHETPYTHSHDEGYWGYGSLEGDSGWGTVWLMCTHTDSKSSLWSNY